MELIKKTKVRHLVFISFIILALEIPHVDPNFKMNQLKNCLLGLLRHSSGLEIKITPFIFYLFWNRSSQSSRKHEYNSYQLMTKENHKIPGSLNFDFLNYYTNRLFDVDSLKVAGMEIVIQEYSFMLVFQLAAKSKMYLHHSCYKKSV